MKNNFIFNENNGKLEFIGNFEALYQNDDDPWGQSGKNSLLAKHYSSSRQKLLSQISNLSCNQEICEIGCGLGYVASFLDQNLADSTIEGIDISETAIEKARKKFPHLTFYVEDISSKEFTAKKNYDVIILNQILWYILKDLDIVFQNINKLLKKDGWLIISTLFLRKQRYGNEIVESFDDLINYCFFNNKKVYRLSFAEIDYTDEASDYMDSILVLQKHQRP